LVDFVAVSVESATNRLILGEKRSIPKPNQSTTRPNRLTTEVRRAAIATTRSLAQSRQAPGRNKNASPDSGEAFM
jgi:hypothetical protein